RLNGVDDAREHGPAARLRHRATHRADQRGYAATERGDRLHLPDAPTAARLDFRNLGHVREQSKGKVLRHHSFGPPPAHGRNAKLGAHGRRDYPPPQHGAAVVTILSQCREFVTRLRFLPARRRLFDEVMEGLESHGEMLAARYIRSGMDPDEAHVAARRQLGNTTRVREEIYTMNSVESLGVAGGDLRYACRILTTNPGFSLAAIATLALGIGATTSIFSILYSVLLKPLPYKDPGRIYSAEIIVPERRDQLPSLPASIQAYLAWREARSDFSEMAALGPWECNLSGDPEPERVGGARVSANFFSFLGVSLPNGRWFNAAEEQPGNERVVIISDALWRRRYGTDPTLVGRA